MTSSAESSDRYERFVGDRYERLRQGADVLARDPAVIDGPFPLNADGLSALVDAIARLGLFDHLDEPVANTVAAMVLIDFHRGPVQIAARIREVLATVTNDRAPDYDTLAVVSGLAAVLALMVDTTAWLSNVSGDVDGIKLL